MLTKLLIPLLKGSFPVLELAELRHVRSDRWYLLPSPLENVSDVCQILNNDNKSSVRFFTAVLFHFRLLYCLNGPFT